MSNLTEVKAAMRYVRLYVLEAMVAEAEMACGDQDAVLRAMEADAKLLFACRNVANAVAESHPRLRPDGWDTAPGGDTA